MRNQYKKMTYLISFIIFISFLIAPVHITHAYFSDSASGNAEIKISLGSIDLEVNNAANTEDLTLGNGINEVELKDVVQNIGTLTGKLAYKINLENTKGEALDPSLLSALKITLNNQELNVNSLDQYLPVLTQEGGSFYLDPEATSKEISIKVKLASEVQQTETIIVEVGYMLLQTNGTITEPLFHDVASSTHKVRLDRTENFWPNKKIYSVGNYEYAIDMPETFYFSNREEWKFLYTNYYHTSINHGTLYLQSVKAVTNWDKMVRMTTKEPFYYKIEPISEYRAKVYFYFDKNISSSDKDKPTYSGGTAFELSNDGRSWNNQTHLQSYTAGKILLSSDALNSTTGRITENEIDLNQSLNQVASLQYIAQKGSKFEKRDVVFDHSIVLNANLYIDFRWLPDIAEPVQVIGNSKIPLLNSLNPSQNLWTIIKKFIAGISDNYNPQLQINLTNSATKQSVVLSRNLTNILQLQNSSRTQQTFSRQSRSLDLNSENNTEPSSLSIEESVPKDSNNSEENQPEVTKEKIPVKQPDKETPKNTEDSNHKLPVVDDEDSDVETPVPVEEKEEIPQESIEEAPETIEEEKPSHLPIDEKFSYLEIKVEDKPYEVGITQEQLDWLMKFKTVEEFTDEVNNEADALFIKYDRIKGIENVETFINQLAEIEQLDVIFEMKDHPKQKIVEIKIIK